MEIGPNKWKSIRTNGNRSEQMEIDPNQWKSVRTNGNRMLRTARNRMPTPKSCSEHCKEQLCHLIVRKFVYWLASICPSNTLDQFVVANFTSFRLTKSILLEMAVYKLQFKLVGPNRCYRFQMTAVNQAQEEILSPPK